MYILKKLKIKLIIYIVILYFIITVNNEYTKYDYIISNKNVRIQL